MSINTITPTFNKQYLSEEINKRKCASDAKNETDDLTFTSKEKGENLICHKSFDDLIEKQRLEDEIKEVWDE
jgi:hypothetical protein